jgi:hypothetical protein
MRRVVFPFLHAMEGEAPTSRLRGRSHCVTRKSGSELPHSKVSTNTTPLVSF